jgi:hypothetical protein
LSRKLTFLREHIPERNLLQRETYSREKHIPERSILKRYKTIKHIILLYYYISLVENIIEKLLKT